MYIRSHNSGCVTIAFCRWGFKSSVVSPHFGEFVPAFLRNREEVEARAWPVPQRRHVSNGTASEPMGAMVGTSPISLPQSTNGRFEVIMIERVS